METRDPTVLKKYKKFIEDVNKGLGYKTNPSTGGDSENHSPTRNTENRKGGLDFSRNSSKIDTPEKKLIIARAARRHGYRVGFEGNHMHIDDNKSPDPKQNVFVTRGGNRELYNKFLSEDKERIKTKSGLFGSPNALAKLKAQADQADTARNLQEFREGTDPNSFTAGADTVERADRNFAMQGAEDRMIAGQTQNVGDLAAGELNVSNEDEQKKARLKNLETLGLPNEERKDFVTLPNIPHPISREELAVLGNDESPQKLKQLRSGLVVANTKIGESATAKAVNGNTDLNKHEKQAINKDMQTPEKVVATIDRNMQTRSIGKEVGVKDSFMEALTFFLPQIGGGLVGAAFAGTEGAIAGAEEGGKAGAAFRDFKLKKAEFNQTERQIQAKANKAERGQVDITPDFVDKNGQPVFSKVIDGQPKFIDQDGNIVDAKTLTSIKALSQDKKQAATSARQDKTINVGKVKATEAVLKEFRKEQSDVTTNIKSNKNIIQLLESGAAITTDQVATFNARGIFNEVGRLSDPDVLRARVPANLFTRVSNSMIEALSGSMGDVMRGHAINLIKQVNHNKREELVESIKNLSNQGRVDRLGLGSIEELQKLFIDDTQVLRGFKSNRTKVKKPLTNADLENMTESQLDAYLAGK